MGSTESRKKRATENQSGIFTETASPGWRPCANTPSPASPDVTYAPSSQTPMPAPS